MKLSSSVSARVNVANNSSATSDVEIELDAGGGERLKIRMTEDGISCFGGSNSSSEITVRGRAGTALVILNPGQDKERVRQAIQKALD